VAAHLIGIRGEQQVLIVLVRGLHTLHARAASRVRQPITEHQQQQSSAITCSRTKNAAWTVLLAPC
jgi:hypothetical protein